MEIFEKYRIRGIFCHPGLRCRHFNLVEIVLAMAVLSIGISSVLVLFPVGVNANRDAVANNNMADLSEYILATIQGGVEAGWTNSGYSDKGIKIASSYPESKELESDFKITGSSSRMIASSSNSGVFLFRQLTLMEAESEKDSDTEQYESVSDFSAVVKVWEGNLNDIYVAVPTGGSSVKDDNGTKERFAKITTADNPDNFAKVVNVEISWPATLNYEDREKAYFRFESFNQKFNAKLVTEN